MITLPEVTVVGTLVADPELRFTPSGVAVANFTVASNDRKKNPQTGEWEDGDATFLRGEIWREHGEHVAESLRKGQRVVVVGRLRQRSYETGEGEKRTAFDLLAEEVTPSLKWATAVVTKAARGASSNGGGAAGKASGWRESGGRAKPATGPSDDPWGVSPEEPPF